MRPSAAASARAGVARGAPGESTANDGRPAAAAAPTWPEFPDWVDFQPLADFRLVAWESDESTVEVLLTSEEYVILKDHLARLRGYVVPGEAAHAN